MEEAREPAITHYDPFGDRKILAGTKEKPEIFMVSSQAMSLASKQFRNMFAADSRFAEATRSPGTIIEKSLLEDHVNSLKILLSIIHLKHSLVPSTLSYDELVQLAILCDYYDVAEVVQPWITNWIHHVQKRQAKNKLAAEGWLFVAWTFGIEDIFERVSTYLIRNVAISTENTIRIHDHAINAAHMPPGVLDGIVEARKKIISALLESCYDYVDRFVNAGEDETICKRESYEKQCDANVYGSLLLGLQKRKLWPKIDSSAIDYSCEDLVNLLQGIEIFTYPHGIHNRKSYYSLEKMDSCNPSKKLKDTVMNVLEFKISRVLESQMHHLEIQREKCPASMRTALQVSGKVCCPHCGERFHPAESLA